MNKRPLVVSSIQSKYMPLGFVTPFNKITEPLNIKSNLDLDVDSLVKVEKKI